MKSEVDTINIRNLYFISTIIQVFLFGYILASIYKLEASGCKCAPDWRRTYILVYSAFAVVVAVGELILLTSNWKVALGVRSMLNLVTILALIVFTYCAITYANRLKTEKCRCSSDLTNEVLYLVGLINAAVLSLAAVIFLLVIISIYMKTHAQK